MSELFSTSENLVFRIGNAPHAGRYRYLLPCTGDRLSQMKRKVDSRSMSELAMKRSSRAKNGNASCAWL
jgi:hypothetical protein